MAALNLTIDKAPTNPKERANENFITVITKHVIIDNGTNKSEKYSLLESDCELYKYTFLIIYAKNVEIKIAVKKFVKLISTLLFIKNSLI